MVQAAVLGVLLAVLVLPVIVVARQPAEERRTLWVLLGVALGLRVVAALALHASGAYQITGRGAVTPDEATVDLAARLLAAGDDRSPVVLGGSLHTSWLLISWSVYDVLWNSLVAIKLLSALLGTVLVVPVYLLAREVCDARTARFAGWLIVVFPSALVWSALALRESLIALLIATLLLLAVRAVEPSFRDRAAHAALAAICLTMLAFTRSYLVPLLIALLLVTAAVRAVQRRGTSQTVVAAGAVAMTLGLLLVLPTGTEVIRVTADLVAAPAGTVFNPFSDCRDSVCVAEADPRFVEVDQGRLPGSRVRGSGDSGDLSGSLQSVGEKGVVTAFAIAVLAGRPVWRTAEFFFLLQPGVVLWWVLLPLLAVGALVLARARRWDHLLATAGYAAAIVVFLAYTGQFIRHHYMIEPVGLVLAAVGIQRLRDGGRGWERTTAMAASLGMAAMAVVSVILSLL
ncbi:MAG TPA: glycosyltransferase family 39 protein [Mycobacteriales bacterium]|nr:glycosyltransferase family 39 protein [Mycobacteriales bacterium]